MKAVKTIAIILLLFTGANAQTKPTAHIGDLVDSNRKVVAAQIDSSQLPKALNKLPPGTYYFQIWEPTHGLWECPIDRSQAEKIHSITFKLD